MNSRVARYFWLLIVILLPLASQASELDHVTSILRPLLTIVIITVIGLLVLGFSTKFLVWPKSSSLAGILLQTVLVLAVLVGIGSYYILHDTIEVVR